MSEKELRRLVTERLVEQVESDPDTALQEIDTARRHLESARRIADDDPTGAFAMAYDAMRKAVAAHMRAHGYRVTKGPGHHLRTGRYAVAALDHLDVEEHIAAVDELRQLRNQSEHEALLIEPEEVDELLLHARVLVDAVEGDLGM